MSAARQAAGEALNPEQHAQIKAQIEAGATPVEIADEWLISVAYTYTLAAKLGARFFNPRQRFERWATTQHRLTVDAVMAAFGCSRGTAYRRLQEYRLARAEGADQPASAAGGRPKTPAVQDTGSRVAAVGGNAGDTPRRGPGQGHPWRRA